MVVGYTGRVLFVNLSHGSIEHVELPEKSYRDLIGGAGIGAKILYERMNSGVDPLGPDNLLGFMTGPLTGAPVPCAARYAVVARSPLTGTWGEAYSGGYFGSELKAAGYDGVFFSGVSPYPVYLRIFDGKAELRKADYLWGKDTTETEDILRQDLGDAAVRVACIGPAGESMSLLASVINDKGRAAARSGLGAVMGAKRLKAIAVRGKRKLQVADARRLKVLRDNFNEACKVNVYLQDKMKYGTCGIFSQAIIRGSTPIKNWTLSGESGMPNHAMLSGDSVIGYQVKKFTCAYCPIGCGGIVNVGKGPFAIREGHKPEYETLASWGALCLNDNVESIIRINDICNRYGIDTISAGATMAFAVECYEKGLIGKQETEGLELTWGNAPAMVTMLERMVKRQGFGAVLADGVKRATAKIGKGSEELAVHIGGREAPSSNPRMFPATGTGYITDPLPGNHLCFMFPAYLERNLSLGPYAELKTPEADLFDCQNENKGIKYARGSEYFQLLNASGGCYFGAAAGIFPLPEYISAVTGWDFSMAEGLTVGRRIQTLRQLFNVREGWRPKYFSLPKRMKDPLDTGPVAGRTFDFDTLRRSYYRAMDWDVNTGEPSKQALRELGLSSLAEGDSSSR